MLDSTMRTVLDSLPGSTVSAQDRNFQDFLLKFLDSRHLLFLKSDHARVLVAEDDEHGRGQRCIVLLIDEVEVELLV